MEEESFTRLLNVARNMSGLIVMAMIRDVCISLMKTLVTQQREQLTVSKTVKRKSLQRAESKPHDNTAPK